MDFYQSSQRTASLVKLRQNTRGCNLCLAAGNHTSLFTYIQQHYTTSDLEAPPKLHAAMRFDIRLCPPCYKVFKKLEEQGICLPKRQPCHTTTCSQQVTPCCAPRPMTLGTCHSTQCSSPCDRLTAVVPTTSAALATQSCSFTCCFKHTLCHADARRPNTAHPPHKPAGGCMHTQLTLLSWEPRRSKHRAHLHTHRRLLSAAVITGCCQQQQPSEPTPLQHPNASTATTSKLMACRVQKKGPGEGTRRAVPGS